MKKKIKIKIEHKVFVKVFAYTMLLLVLMSLTAVALFSQQFLSFYREEQRRQLSEVFQPVVSAISVYTNDSEEIIETAKRFADNNQSFKFRIWEDDVNILYSSFDDDEFPGFLTGESIYITHNPTIMHEQSVQVRTMGQIRNIIEGTEPEPVYALTWYSPFSDYIDYGDLIKRSFLALAFMLVIAVLGAFLFAFKITKPLEDEIRWVRVMEENQRLFFSAASHELKTPIASARALVEGMIAGVGDYKDHQKYLRECLKTFDAQGNLVSEILDIVKLSDTQVKFEPASIDLAELGNSVLAEYSQLAEQRGLTVQCEIKKTVIKADFNLLRKVLSNVTANAVQNTKAGQFIRIGTEENDRTHIRLYILNTGAQIQQEVLPKLFDPFYRIDTARTKSGTQTGLGLAIVKKALDRMNFSFALENAPDGVVFWVDLPLCD